MIFRIVKPNLSHIKTIIPFTHFITHIYWKIVDNSPNTKIGSFSYIRSHKR